MADQVKKRVATAVKRMKQSQKRCLRNRAFKSRVKTAIRAFEASRTDTADQAHDPDRSQQALNLIYSLLDKGVKHRIFTKNKAGRTKSRLTRRLSSAVPSN